jgi:hypothetical protein
MTRALHLAADGDQQVSPSADHLPNVAFDNYPDQVDFMPFIPVSPTQTPIPESRRDTPPERYA